MKGFRFYVINLDRSKQRWKRISQHLRVLSIRPIRISAVDAKMLTQQQLDECYSESLNQADFFLPLSAAEKACFMSHMKALNTFIDAYESDSHHYAIILEDDVEVVGDLNMHADQWREFLSSNQPTMLKIYAKRPVVGRVIDTNVNTSVLFPKVVPLGCQGAVFNVQAARLLVDKYSQFGVPVDVAYQFWWQHGVRVLVAQPNQLNEISDYVGGSNIAKKQKFSWWKVKRELKRSWFRFKLKINSTIRYYLSGGLGR